MPRVRDDGECKQHGYDCNRYQEGELCGDRIVVQRWLYKSSQVKTRELLCQSQFPAADIVL